MTMTQEGSKKAEKGIKGKKLFLPFMTFSAFLLLLGRLSKPVAKSLQVE